MGSYPAEGAGAAALTEGDRADIARALKKAAGFENAETSSLMRLAARAERLGRDELDRPLLEQRTIPRAFYVVLEGKLEAFRDGGAPGLQNAPYTVGSLELLQRRGMPASFYARDAKRQRVFRVTAEAFEVQLAEDVDLQNAVRRFTAQGAAPAPAPLPTASRVHLLTAGKEPVGRMLGVPGATDDAALLRCLVDCVADVIAGHLGDPVIAIHVMPPIAEGAPDRTARHEWIHLRDAAQDPRLGPLPKGAPPYTLVRGERSAPVLVHVVDDGVGLCRPVTVHHRHLPIDASDVWKEIEEIVAHEIEHLPEDDPTVVLLEAASLPAPTRPVPYNVVHLVRTPGTPLTVEPRGADLRVLPTALLGSAPPHATDAPWPPAAVRLRLGPRFGEALHRAVEAGDGWLDLVTAMEREDEARLERWARAITGRRVGIALGGGGPFGFVHAPLLELLEGVGVPVDMVSGSSMGAVVGAYFAALPDGIERFKDNRFELLRGTLLLGYVGTGEMFERVLGKDLKDATITDLDVPFFPVVTDARTGVEWSIRHGPVARGVRASGSLPPVFPTTRIGDRRYLDGGVVAQVPSRVLREEGAALVISSNAVSDVERWARSKPAFPWLFDNTPQLFLRFVDTLRLMPMLFGALGETQSGDAHVRFRPTSEGRAFRLLGLRPIDLVGLVTQGNCLVPRWVQDRVGKHARDDEDAATSLELSRAVNQAKDAWRELLSNPPAFAWIDWALRAIVLDKGYAMGFADPESSTIDTGCFAFVREIADLLNGPEGMKVGRVTVRVRAADAQLGLERAECVVQELAARGVVVRDRVIAEGRATREHETDAVEFVDVQESAGRMARDLEGQLRKTEAQAHRLALLTGAEEARLHGDPDLSRMLAIEASNLDRGTETDSALRKALLLPARVERTFDAGAGVTAMAWRPVGGILAVGDKHGRVHLLDRESGRVATAKERHVGADRETGKKVRGVAWSPDGDLVASVSHGGRVLVHQVAAGDAPPTFHCDGDAGGDQVSEVAFSPKGGRLLVTRSASDPAIAERCVGLFAVSPAGVRRSHTLAHDAAVSSAAWDPSGEVLAVGDEGGVVRLWDAASGAQLGGVSLRRRGEVQVAWVRRGAERRLAIACERDAAVVVVDDHGVPGPPVELLGHTGPLRAIAWSSGGARIVTAGADHTARVWDSRTGRLLMVVRWSAAAILGAAWQPGEDRMDTFATWSEDGKVQVWDAPSGELLAVLSGHRTKIQAAAFDPAGSCLATGTARGRVRVFSLVEPVPKLVALQGIGAAPVTSVSWCGPEQVIVASHDGSVRVWEPSTNMGRGLIAPPESATDHVAAHAALSPDGRTLAATQRPARALRLFDASTWKELATLDAAAGAQLPEDPARDTVYWVAWSASGRHVSVNYGQSVAVWDVTTGELRRVIPRRGGDLIRSVAWHPTDAGRLVVGEHGVMVWSIDDDEPLASWWDDATGYARRVAWSPDGARIAVGHHTKRAQVYDVATRRVFPLDHTASVRAIAWSPDGARVATGDSGGGVRVWESKGDAYLCAGAGAPQPGPIRALAWSAGGERLLSCGDGARVALWTQDPAGGDKPWVQAAVIEGHRAPVGAMALDPAGRRVATGDDDGTVRVDPVDMGALVEALGSQLWRKQMSDEEWRRHMSWAGAPRPSWPPPERPGASSGGSDQRERGGEAPGRKG